MHFLSMLLCGLFILLPASAAPADPASQIASLIDPAKLATLGVRGANGRVQKAVYWLETARRGGEKPAAVLDTALKGSGYKRGAAKITKDSLLRNLRIAEQLGCLNDAGMAEMRRGKSPTVTTGPCKGDELSVDHILPRAVVPELDNVIANLELMPLRLNESKSAKIGDRQRSMARKFQRAGLLSRKGLEAVLR